MKELVEFNLFKRHFLFTPVSPFTETTQQTQGT